MCVARIPVEGTAMKDGEISGEYNRGQLVVAVFIFMHWRRFAGTRTEVSA